MITKLLPDLNSYVWTSAAPWPPANHQFVPTNCLQFFEDILNWGHYSMFILRYPTCTPLREPRNHPSNDKILLYRTKSYLIAVLSGWVADHFIAYTNLESACFRRHILLHRRIYLWLSYALLQTQLVKKNASRTQDRAAYKHNMTKNI